MLYHLPEGPLSRTDRLVYGLLGAGLVAVGLFVGFELSGEAQKGFEARSWPRTTCLILASEVREDGRDEEPYAFHPRYRYEWEGKPYVAERYRTEHWGTADIAEADRLARRFPPGGRRACYVNPADPSEAVLEHTNVGLAVGVLVLFGLLLAGVAQLMIVPAVRGYGYKTKRLTKRQEVAIGILFTAVGLAAFAWLSALPLSQALRARGWRPTPCTVRSATLRKTEVHGEVHLTLFRPDIVYAYRVNGRDYRANAFNFTDRSTPWYYGKRGVLAAYPPGRRTTCYVDPRDPTSAVLTRDLRLSSLFGALPLVISILGAGSIAQSTRTRRALTVREQRAATSLLLAVLASVLSLVFVTLGADLLRDLRVGTAEIPEVLVVLASAAAAAAADLAFLKSLRLPWASQTRK
jgi:hypothetical protein